MSCASLPAAAGNALADSQGVAQAEIPFVQRAPDDHADDAGVESGPKSANVIEARDAARCNNRDANQPGDFFDPGRIDAHLRAIADDVGHDCGADPRRAKPISRLGDSERAGLDPSLYGQPAVANVD